MTEYSWKSGIDGDWSQAADWTPGTVPNAATADATISAAGSFTVTISAGESFSADSVTLASADATLDVDGYLGLAGTADQLVLAAGELEIGSGGTIAGGTIDAIGADVSLPSGGALFGAVVDLAGDTWIGDLDIGNSNTNYLEVDVQGGLAVENASGGPGTINITGRYNGLDVTDNETLDNLGINLGGAGANYDNLDAGSTLVLGNSVTVNGIYGNNQLSGNVLVNDGTINAQSGYLYTSTGSFTNAGIVNAAAGAKWRSTAPA